MREDDLAAVRAEIARVAGKQALSGLQTRLLGAQSVSDLVHWNRVEGSPWEWGSPGAAG